MPRRKPEDPSRVRVRVLGATEITVGHRRIGMNTELLFALALYLTTRAGEPIPREELLHLFWHEGSEEDHRHALRQQMYRLRQKGFDVDDAGELIRLDPARVESDLRNALGETWWETAAEDAIAVACEWGPSFSRQKAPAFHEWLDSVRDSLGQNVRRAALRQIGIARREGRWADLDRWGRVILKTDPLNEEGTLARAESAAMAGSKTIALEIIDNYLSELGDLSPELGRPVLQMRKRIAERRPDWAMRGPKEVPLVGRTELMTKLTGLVEDVWKGEGRAVVLTGAAGIGKTRLAMEARAYAELKGMRVAQVRSDPAGAARPLATVQRLVATLLELPGAAGCHPRSLQLLRRILEQNEKLSRQDVSAMMVSISDALPNAIVDLCDAIAHEARVLVVVDDFHHMDSHSAKALDVIIGATARRRFGWIFTARERARGSTTESALPAGAIRHRVTPLARNHARELAATTGAAHGLQMTTEALDSLARVSGGNALFVRELAVSSRNRPNAAGLPESLSLLIEERLDGLSTAQRQALGAIAFMGETATLELLELATERSAGDLAADFEALENDGVVGLNESQHLVLHECWRQAVLDGLTGTSRSALAKRCADVLSAFDERRRGPQHDWCAAQLYKEAGYFSHALPLYMRAAEGLYAAGLPEESVRVVRAARELAPPGDHSVELQSRLVCGLLASGQHLAAIEESTNAISQLGRSRQQERTLAAALLCARVDALIRAGQPLDEEIRALAELSVDPALPLAQRQGCALMGIVWASNVANEELKERFRNSTEFLMDGERPSLAGLLVRVIHASESRAASEIDAAIAQLRATDTSNESMYLRCRALRIEGRALRQLGRPAEARDALLRSYELAHSSNLFSDASIAAEALTFLALDEAQVEEAEVWLERFYHLTPNKESYERKIALNHCHERLLIQRGLVGEVLTRLDSRAREISSDWNARRKLTELSTYAFSLAHSRSASAANEVLPQVLELLQLSRKDFAADYAVEMLCRTFRLLGRDAEADALANRYVSESSTRVDRVYGEFHTELRAAAR